MQQNTQSNVQRIFKFITSRTNIYPGKARSFQLLATTLLPEYPKPGASSMISITPIPCFSAQIHAPESAEFGQQGIS